jgi:hypothetical protein
VVQRLGKRPTTAERIEIAEKRERLQARIDVFHKKASEFWQPDTHDASLYHPEDTGDNY